MDEASVVLFPPCVLSFLLRPTSSSELALTSPPSWLLCCLRAPSPYASEQDTENDDDGILGKFEVLEQGNPPPPPPPRRWLTKSPALEGIDLLPFVALPLVNA
eukprot:762462-Hanusia_phi.AAC.2